MKKLAKRLLAALLALTLLSAMIPAAMAANETCGDDCTVSGCTCGAAHTGAPCDCAACSAFQSITADVSSVTLRPTETKFLAITASYPSCSGKANEAVSSGLTFNSSNNTVATVDTAGRITGVADGVADITVKLNDNVKCHVIVTVASTPAVTAAITPDKVSYVTGETVTLKVAPSGGYGLGTYSYQWKKDGNALTGKTAQTLYISSATTDDKGSYTCVVTSKKTGSPDMSKESNALAITVTAPAYTVSLTPVSGLSLKAGEYGYVYATIMQGANVYKTPTTVSFTSTSPSNATVSSSANTNATNGTATATVSALKKGTTSIYATVSIGGQSYTSNTVPVSVTSSYTMDTINYVSDSDGYATFDGYDFAKAFKDATGYTLSYVNFTSQYGGQLYKDADSTSNSNKVTSSTDCYYNPSYSSRVDLDKVTFIVDSDKKSHYAEFTAYGSGVTATGKVTIDGDGTASGDIVYYVSYEDTVALDEDDFQSFFEDEYSKGTLEHVKFLVGDATYYGTSAYGWLYESDASSAKKVSASTRFYYEADSKQDDLDAVVFTAGTRTSTYTVKIPFTATGKDKNDRPRTVDGKLVIEVNGKRNVTITLEANQDGYAVFSKDDMEAAIRDAAGVAPEYIKFSAQSGGTLYKNSESTETDNKVGREKYYFSEEPAAVERTIFYKGDTLPSSKVNNGKYPIKLIAYALDKNTGSLTEQEYLYKADGRNALAGAPTGFYTVYVSSTNELTFKGVTAGTAVTTPDATSAANYAENKVGSVLQVRKVDGSYLVLDGGSKDIAAYTLCDMELFDYNKVEAGDFLYVYKNADNGKFTVVDAVDVATIKFFCGTTELKGTATEEVIGHKWEAMTVLSIDEGYEKVGFTVRMYDTEAEMNADTANTAGVEVPVPTVDSDTITVRPYIKICVNTTAGYSDATLDAGKVNATTGMSINGSNITITVNYTLDVLKMALEEATTVAGATVEVYSAVGTVADSNYVAGTEGWYIVVTALDGVTTMTYYLSGTTTYSAPMELQGVALQSVEAERQMLDGVCFRLADGAEEGSVSYTTYDASGAPIAMGRIVIKPAAAPPTVSAGSARVKAGKTVQIPLKLENNPGFADLSVEIAWDKSVMALESTEPTAFGGILTTSQTVQKNPYLLNWTSTQNLTYNGTLALLNFTVREDAPEGEYPITVCYYRGIDGANRDGEDVNYDENHTAVPFAYESGTVTVLHYTPGDTTGDDKVTSRDAVYILQYLAGWDVEGLVPAAMDVDGNGRINSWDAILLLRYIAGWDIELH